MTLLTTTDAAAYLGIALPTFYMWKRKGIVTPAGTFAGRPFYNSATLDAVKRPAKGAPARSGKYVNWRKRGKADV
jgi:predicted site-specific integrase-resolvase